MHNKLDPALRYLTLTFLTVLIFLCIAWESFLAPLRPQGSWLVLKALPLAFAIPGIKQGRIYTFQWSSMLAMAYLIEGIVRAMSDVNAQSSLCAIGEIVWSTLFFLSAIYYVYTAKKSVHPSQDPLISYKYNPKYLKKNKP